MMRVEKSSAISRGMCVYNVQSAPCIQRVIHLKLMFQVFEVVRETQAVAGGNCFKPAPDGIRVDILSDIRCVDNLCEAQQPGVLQIIFQYYRLKGTASCMMTELHTRRIERDRARFLCNRVNLAFGYEQKFCFIIDKTRDQPRTGDTVNMDM